MLRIFTPHRGYAHGVPDKIPDLDPIANATPDPGMKTAAPQDSQAQDRVTLILERAAQDGRLPTPELLPVVYDELRRLANWHMQNEPAGHTLQPTALVHEAYLRLLGGGEEVTWENRRHFIGAAAEAMRRILIERARRYSRKKHGGEYERQSPTALDALTPTENASTPEELLALDEAMSRLESADAEAALVAKLRHFSGFTVDETAELLGVSRRTVIRKWALARAWLLRELDDG